MPGKCTVIYVMSDVRSGSTLLENILSKSEETVSVGEMALLKSHLVCKGPGAKWNWNCSCGVPPAECSFWNNALEGLPLSGSEFNTAVAWNFRSKKMVAGCLLPFFTRYHLQQLRQKKQNRNTIATNQCIYRNIFKQTGKQFIIDSSKDPVQAYLTYINKPQDFDVKIISLTRDLRAIAASKRKWSLANNKSQKPLGKWLANSLLYRKICGVVAALVQPADVIAVSYEQLATATQPQLNAIAAVCGFRAFDAPVYMAVENDHTIAGTPARFNKRPIAYDASWTHEYTNKRLLSFFGRIMNAL